MNLKYTLGAIVSVPLLPLLYFQGKRIRKTIPKLPEATGIEGISNVSSNQTFQLITIGESTIAGVGATEHKTAFTGTLATALSAEISTNVAWKVYAKSGYTAKRVTHKIIKHINEKPVDLIVIGLGGNDSFVLNTPKKWNADIRELIATIRKKYPETPIVFTNMPPIKEFTAFSKTIKFVIGNLVLHLGKELEKIVKDYENVHYYARKIEFDDYVKRMNLNNPITDFFSDGVHPSEFAYQVWAKDVANYILEQKII
ncbi:SGNH/GDSL hydrolase family protein [Kordia algicida OT-1]|uniref:Lipolytic enzyme, G-D-S-L n=1 Tax=Kordia algicida OT-1 TaxID=391587 RepID=A9DMU5_9FLAO|nr:SGNH/GDSL hydrolase family protein [Kordia algicida]EDP97790.1 lipolytic enzyme, G-D-S-L [Kordia algicida OT-1]